MDRIIQSNQHSISFALDNERICLEKENCPAKTQILEWKGQAQCILDSFQKIDQKKAHSRDFFDLTKRVDSLLQELVSQGDELSLTEHNGQNNDSLHSLVQTMEFLFNLRRKMMQEHSQKVGSVWA
jgi:hypothetical protein